MIDTLHNSPGQTRERMLRALGPDYAYFNAQRNERHFDPNAVVFSTLLGLLLAAITAAFKEVGKSLGKAGWNEMLSRLEIDTPEDHPDLRKQLDTIKNTEVTLAQAGSVLSLTEGKALIENIRSNVEHELLALRFPAANAHRIARELSVIIEEKLTGNDRSS